jgi:hypothetical protein
MYLRGLYCKRILFLIEVTLFGKNLKGKALG